MENTTFAERLKGLVALLKNNGLVNEARELCFEAGDILTIAEKRFPPYNKGSFEAYNGLILGWLDTQDRKYSTLPEKQP